MASSFWRQTWRTTLPSVSAVNVGQCIRRGLNSKHLILLVDTCVLVVIGNVTMAMRVWRQIPSAARFAAYMTQLNKTKRISINRRDDEVTDSCHKQHKKETLEDDRQDISKTFTETSSETYYEIFITFHVSRRRREMYSGHGHLCVSLSLASCPHYCTDPDVTWGNGRGAP